MNRPALLVLLLAAAAPGCSSAPPVFPKSEALVGAYQIAWVGDILQGDTALPLLEQHGYLWPFEHVNLLEADHAIGNAEGPVTPVTEKYYPDQKWSYNADPRAAPALRAVGLDAVGLANNHIFDRGSQGIGDSFRFLGEAGVRAFGAGLNEEQAAAPHLVQTPHGTIAVLGFTEKWRRGSEATGDQPGTITMSPATITRGAGLARAAGARWLVAFVHWGKNYSPVVDSQRQAAGWFAQAGYTLVVGHHAHVPQEVEIVNGMPVLYSLGNFAFGSGGRFSDEYPGRGLVARTYFDAAGLLAITLSCLVTDNYEVQFQARPCSEADSEEVMRSLGPNVVWRDGFGFVAW